MLMTQHPTRDAATLAVCHGHRPQPYRFIHKALRRKMTGVLTQLAAADPHDDSERRDALDALEELLSVCEAHLTHENGHFHRPLAAAGSRAVLAFEDDHEDHVTQIRALRDAARSLEDSADTRSENLYALTLKFSRFVGENFEHMADEETLLTHALWSAFDDATILGFERGLTSTFTPEQSAYYLRWMARALNVAELADLLHGARREVPAEVFSLLCGIVREEVTDPRWSRIAQALELGPDGSARAA